MAKAIAIAATKSNDGKTLLTTALLHHFKKDVQAFKCGPDYIDPQYHSAITGGSSINLDGYLMNQEQLKWIFQNYHKSSMAVIEGVMGFYDGMDKNASIYDVSKTLNIPTILVVDGSGSYITIAAVIKGVLEFRKNNTIKAVILNNISSSMHFALVKNIIKEELPNLVVLGWIKKNIETLESTHLGLDLENLNKGKLEKLSTAILENIDLKLLEELSVITIKKTSNYPFEKIPKINKKLAIAKDKNFSFLYHDNLTFLKEVFKEVTLISAVENESFEADVLYIPGGYVETQEAYERVKNSFNFQESVKKHVSKNRPIYAECAGLIYLGKQIDEKKMLNILDVSFTLEKHFIRLGYYESHFDNKTIKGHAFHYSKPVCLKSGCFPLIKNNKGNNGAWKNRNTFGTYLHVFFRTNVCILRAWADMLKP